jgi:hypothetical protein
MRDVVSNNPYAPPEANLTPRVAAGQGCMRDGRILVVARDTDLPGRCVKCNEPALPSPKQRTLYWHTPWLFVLVPVAVLLYLIIAVAIRKKAPLSVGLCARHDRTRQLGTWIGWLGSLTGIGLMVWAAAVIDPLPTIFGALVLLVGIVAGTVLSRPLVPVKIDERWVRLKGAGSAFLDSLPPYQP